MLANTGLRVLDVSGNHLEGVLPPMHISYFWYRPEFQLDVSYNTRVCGVALPEWASMIDAYGGLNANET